MLVSLHHLRHAAGLRAHPQQRNCPSYRHLHPELGASQLGRQPGDLLHVLRQLQQVPQVRTKEIVFLLLSFWEDFRFKIEKKLTERVQPDHFLLKTC